MTVKEFSKIAEGIIEVKSSYNGKILCKNFNYKKHIDIGNREVYRIWSEIRVTKCVGYNNIASPIICVFVDGINEYESEHKND